MKTAPTTARAAVAVIEKVSPDAELPAISSSEPSPDPSPDSEEPEVEPGTDAVPDAEPEPDPEVELDPDPDPEEESEPDLDPEEESDPDLDPEEESVPLDLEPGVLKVSGQERSKRGVVERSLVMANCISLSGLESRSVYQKVGVWPKRRRQPTSSQ